MHTPASTARFKCLSVPRSLILAAIIGCSAWGVSDGAGLHIGLDGGATTFSMSPNGQVSIVLTLTNEDALPMDLLAAQVVLTTQSGGTPADSGSVTLQSAVAIDDALFNLPVPLVIPMMGGTFVQTAGIPDPSTLAQAETRTLFRLDLQATSDALGTHHLFMKPSDIEDFNSSGALALLQGEPIPVPYANAGIPEFADYVLLATFEIVGQSPGDYDRNGKVDAQDYHAWKESFGQAVETPGSDADGNQDGVINLADYVVWRDNLGGGEIPDQGATLTYAPVPETPARVLAGLACLAGVLTGSVMKSRNSRSVMGRDEHC